MLSFGGNDIPWTQVGPSAFHKWDWSRPELRAELRVGTVLESHDCAYIVVLGVTPEGVISQTFRKGEDVLWTWQELTRSGYLIYEQPQAGNHDLSSE